MTRYWYAGGYACGARTFTLHRFGNRDARNAWVARGWPEGWVAMGAPCVAPGERTALTYQQFRRLYGDPDKRCWDEE